MAWEFVEDNGYNAGPELYLDWYDDDPKFIATGGSTSHDAGAGGFGLQVAGVGGYSIEEAQMQDKSKAKRKRQNTKTRFKQRTTEERERLFVEQERIFAEQEINVVVEDLAISDAYDTDELESLKGNENDGEIVQLPVFNEAVEFEHITIELGMEFPNLKVFRNAVRDYNISRGREVRFKKNESTRVRAKCVEKECKWVILCSLNKKNNTYQVKTFGSEHTCCRKLQNKLATREWVASKLVPRVRFQPSMTGQEAYDYLMHSYRVKVGDAMIYRALCIAHKTCQGSENEQYAKLRDYCNELLKSNPGSSVGLNVAPVSHHFQRMYVCLEACKTGFLSCGRPLIGLDGCFLKGYFGGQLLSAVAQDGNNAFYVIAYAIVDVENKENWRWFLINLVDDLGDPVLNGFSFMSDMQKGLDAALKEICPGVQHRFCARHIWANFNKNWPGKELKDAFWACARAATEQQFQLRMDHLKTISLEGWLWLSKLPPDRWTRSAFDTYSKNDSLTNNMCEQFNSEIMKVRNKPIITMVEGIRMYIMKKMTRSKLQMAKYKGPLCPRIQTKLEIMKNRAAAWTPHWAGDPDMVKFELLALALII
ncbi:uncharacterized protein LOC116204115 [Punica granatum]|uniref:Uncharacterized protein LOC116204115 n=1 Tax=Punica granatum TaxID=22663 RepID=A0A6P8DF51_PUNGR|nr:uncharacterized protein LOC116204115 [Punica granatum]